MVWYKPNPMAAEERATGGPETVVPVQQTVAAATEISAQTPPVPNFYIKRPVEGLVLPLPDQLMESARAELKVFFGREVAVFDPPSLLSETQRLAENEGFNFAPIFFPAIEFKPDSDYPGWKDKPEEWYWRQIGKRGGISEDAAKLGGFWGLLDISVRPNYNNGRQLFDNDALGNILKKGRRNGKIVVPDYLQHVPDTSRFGVSPNEQDAYVFPELAKVLNLSDKIKKGIVQTRRLTEMEFNFAGNLRYTHFGEANTWEWLHDNFGDGDRLDGGHSGYGGLALVYDDWSGFRDDDLGFRPLVVFLSKS